MIDRLKNISKQFAKFSAVGVTAFAIDYGVMVLCAEIFGLDYISSTTIGFLVALVFNYMASMRFVFERREGMDRRREFLVFCALSVIGLALNDFLMWAVVDLAQFDYRIAKIAVASFVSFYNFFSRKAFLESKESPEIPTPTVGS